MLPDPSILALAIVAVPLAAANGANDNFKGVATLHGSGAASYRRALAWATLSTLAGSLAALFVARGLLARFSGSGLVTAAVAADPAFLAAVGLGAAAAVLLATRLGLPVSTTHALVGGLLGSGLVLAGPSGVSVSALSRTFVLPLLLSPFLALVLAALLYTALERLRRASGVTEETCVCVGGIEQMATYVPGAGAASPPGSC